MMGHWRTAVLLALVGAALCACDGSANSPADAERARGKALLTSYGCVSCHSIKGLQAGAGAAGPPMEKIADNSYIAGVLPNNQAALEQWIVAPRRISPGTAMPELGVSPDEARAMAVYLLHQ
jgi:cytochrome c2